MFLKPQESNPQGLKPSIFAAPGGTAKAVPSRRPFVEQALICLRHLLQLATQGHGASH